MSCFKNLFFVTKKCKIEVIMKYLENLNRQRNPDKIEKKL